MQVNLSSSRGRDQVLVSSRHARAGDHDVLDGIDGVSLLLEDVDGSGLPPSRRNCFGNGVRSVRRWRLSTIIPVVIASSLRHLVRQSWSSMRRGRLDRAGAHRVPAPSGPIGAGVAWPPRPRASSGARRGPPREGATPHRRVGPLRADGVDADPVVGPLLGEALDQVDHPGLARRVRDVVRPPARERARGERRQRSGARAQVGVGRASATLSVPVRLTSMTSASSAGEQSATAPIRRTRRCKRRGRARRAGRPRRRPGRTRLRFAHVEPDRAPVDLDPGARLRAPPAAIASPIPFVPPTTRTRAPSSERCGAERSSRDRAPHLDHPVREDHVEPGRDLQVRLVPGDGDDPGARDVAQDEAAVVGGAEVAGRGGRLVGPGEDRAPGTPGASGRGGSATVGIWTTSSPSTMTRVSASG